MAIPKINLIPPAYYLRKQVRLATILSVLGVLAVVAGLVAFAMVASAKNKDLKEQQAFWQTKADAVASTNQQAQAALDAVADLTGKTEFVTAAFDSNAQWAAVFENIRDYTYPRVTYTSIEPTAGSDIVKMHIKVPGTRAVPAQEALNLYWANLTRSPKIVAAAPNTMLGYPAAGATEGGGGDLGAPTAGGPPLPGGPPMPGGAPAPAPYINSPGQLAAPAVSGLSGQPYDVTALSGQGLAANPDALRQYLSSLLPPPPPTFEFDITAQLNKPITVATYQGGGAAGADQGGLPADGGLPVDGGLPANPGGPPPMPGGPPAGGPPLP